MVSSLCCPFFHGVSWMRSWTKLSQFLRVFLSTLEACKSFQLLSFRLDLSIESNGSVCPQFRFPDIILQFIHCVGFVESFNLGF